MRCSPRGRRAASCYSASVGRSEMVSTQPRSARDTVLGFFAHIRSGRALEQVHDYLQDRVAAHQLQAEAPETLARTPEDYADHVREMLAECGPFTLQLEEVLCDGDRVYVRWRQQSQAADGRPI